MRLTSARDRSMINDGLAVRLEERLMIYVGNEGILCFGTLKLWVVGWAMNWIAVDGRECRTGLSHSILTVDTVRFYT